MNDEPVVRFTFAPTWSNIADVIRSGDDDLYGIAGGLGCDLEALKVALAEMTDKALLVRWNDGGVTRYRVPGEKGSTA